MEHYLCEDCGWGCDKVGNAEMFVSPGNACVTGKHTPGTEWHEADYTSCNGGYKSGWYECSECRQPCDAEGKAVEWEEGTGKHTRGTEEFPADYTPCFGGFRESHYECVACHCPLDAEGNVIEPEPGTGSHTPGTEKHEPDYTPCSGGFVGEWYVCDLCHQPVAADGGEAAWEEAKEGHRIVEVPEKAPTYESEGNWAYWECEVCHSIYRDAEGTEIIEDWEEIVRPRLDPEEPSSMETTIKEGLNEVPEAVAAQYPTVEDIYKALLEAALSGNSAMKKENTNSVLLDVSLEIHNPDGTVTKVEAENFPEEGVEVLLPYPEGTNRTYIFVITHMIASGEHAGEIEVLNYRTEADGLRVRFTSMSPVCIAYQAGSSSTITIIAGNTTSESGSNPTTGAANPQTLPVLLFGGALVVLLAVKKKKA